MDGRRRVTLDENIKEKYHGQRRNATVGNIRFNRQAEDSGATGKSHFIYLLKVNDLIG